MEEENWFEGEPVLRGPAGGMRVWAEVRLDAVVRNLAHIRQLLPPETGIYGVVKAEGYGHGSRQVAAAVQNLDYVKGFAVAAFEEACALRDYGILKPVLVLGYTFPCCYEQMARREIRPAVFRPDSIEALASAARRAGKPIKVHVKVDTGMNRIGIRPDREGLAFIADLAGREGIEIEGIFTHFARADEADKSNAEKQLGTFQEFLHRIERELSLKIPIRHCANSAGALEMDGVGMDAVRAGIAMYGICPSGRREGSGLSLEQALSLYSSIVYVKTVGAGESVSYGAEKSACGDGGGRLRGRISQRAVKQRFCADPRKAGADPGTGMYGPFHGGCDGYPPGGGRGPGGTPGPGRGGADQRGNAGGNVGTLSL